MKQMTYKGVSIQLELQIRFYIQSGFHFYVLVYFLMLSLLKDMTKTLLQITRTGTMFRVSLSATARYYDQG